MIPLYYHTIVGMCTAEDRSCSLHAAAKAPKYLDCPLLDTTNEFFSGEASGLTIVNVSWRIEYCNYIQLSFLPCSVFHVDYSGIYSHDAVIPLKLLPNFEVTSSGQLYISSVGIDMRWTTFNCSVWNDSTSQWSRSHTIGPLIILDYGKLKLISFSKHSVMMKIYY